MKSEGRPTQLIGALLRDLFRPQTLASPSAVGPASRISRSEEMR